MNNIGIFGASGFAREVGDIAYALDLRPIYIARDQDEIEAWTFQEEIILESQVGCYHDMNFAIGVGDNVIRARVFQKFMDQLKFVNLIHPAASLGRGTPDEIAMRQGVIVCAGVRLTNNIKVGNFSIFNLNATVGHDVIIDDFVNIAPGAHISGNVHVGAKCWVGTGAAINQGNADVRLHIGVGTVIGSGSVVVKECEPNSVYVGIPAKKIK